MNDGLDKVYSPDGTGKRLAKVLNRGGEGVIHHVEGNDNILVKIYSRRSHATANRDKIHAMLGMREFKDSRDFAWPRMPVLNAPAGDLIGFGMRKASGHSLHTLSNPVLVREKLPGWTRLDSLEVCASFLNGLDQLHAGGVMVGDLNPGNVLFHPKSKKVTFIDCDSYQIPNGGKPPYLCTVGIQHFMAPEVLDVDLRRHPRTVEQEHFSMAVMLFRILMLGAHPYACVQGDDPVQNLRQGLCPLGTGTGLKMPRGPWYNIWSHMPFRLKSLFIQTFRDGHRNVHKRPTSKDYADALGKYAYRIRQGKSTNELIPKLSKASQPNHVST